jgi:hypothetical protein
MHTKGNVEFASAIVKIRKDKRPTGACVEVRFLLEERSTHDAWNAIDFSCLLAPTRFRSFWVNIGGHQVKRLVFTFLSTTAAVCALASATPALAAGADAHGGQEQAQMHPNEANQPPVWSANGVAEGEVYPADQAYGGGAAEAAAPPAGAGVILQLPFGAAETYRPAAYGARDAYAYVPAPYGADDANAPGRLSATAARERCHVVHVHACLRATTP